jgi:hypothetical protein
MYAPKKGKIGRPMRGEEKLEGRIQAVVTVEEKAALEAIAREKRWSMTSLIRDVLEEKYPQAFKKEHK